MSIALKSPVRFEHTFFLENATAVEDDPSHQFDLATTLTKLRIVLRGTTPSVTWTLRHDSVRTAAGTVVATGTSTNTTTGDEVTSFSDATIPAGNHLWLETSAVGGTVLSFRMTVIGTED